MASLFDTFNKLSTISPESIFYINEFKTVCTEIIDKLKKLKFDDSETANCHSNDVSDEAKNVLIQKVNAMTEFKPIIDLILSVVDKNFEEYSVDIVLVALETLSSLSQFYLYASSFINTNIFQTIETILNSQHVCCYPICFQIVGNLCGECDDIQNKLLELNLLPSYLKCFERLLLPSSTSSTLKSVEYSLETCKALSSTIQHNKTIQSVFIENGAHRLILQYISQNYLKESDSLICGCLRLMQYVSDYDEAKSALECDLLNIILLIIKDSPNKEVVNEALDYLEHATIKYSKSSSFAMECLTRNFFTDLLSYVEPFKDFESSEEQIFDCLNILIFISLPLNCSQYIYKELNLKSRMLNMVLSKNKKYSLSSSLLVGNLCYNDEITNELVSKNEFHALILNNIIDVGIEEKSDWDILVSAFSILKNLSIPVSNRYVISSNNNFDFIIKKCMECSNHIVLQKLFVFLRIIVTVPTNSYALTIIKDKKSMELLVTYSTEPEKYLIIKSSALALLLQIIVNSQDRENVDFINEFLLKEIINHSNPQFLGSFFSNLQSNFILFSFFTEEHILFLLQNGYYKSMYDLAIANPPPVVLLKQFIPPLLRIFLINDSKYRSYIENVVTQKLYDSYQILTKYPNLISKEDFDLFSQQFYTKITSFKA